MFFGWLPLLFETKAEEAGEAILGPGAAGLLVWTKLGEAGKLVVSVESGVLSSGVVTDGSGAPSRLKKLWSSDSDTAGISSETGGTGESSFRENCIRLSARWASTGASAGISGFLPGS
jgi:hypothetical protein